MAKYSIIKATKELGRKEQYAIVHSSVIGLKDNVPLSCHINAVVHLNIKPESGESFDEFDQFVLMTDKGLFGSSSEALVESLLNMATELDDEFEGSEIYIHYKQSKKNSNRKYLVADLVM